MAARAVTWSFIEPVEHIKGTYSVTPIVLSNEYVPSVSRYLSRPRDGKATSRFRVIERRAFHLDAGGMIAENQRTFERDFFGLELSIFAIHVDVVMSGAVKPAQRRGHGLLYVPSWPVGIALDDKQHNELYRWLLAIGPEAAAIASVENEEFNKRFVSSPYVKAAPRPVGPKGDA